jgi:DNA (cytosine-5)-methyltransferase 1
MRRSTSHRTWGVWTSDLEPTFTGRHETLGDVLEADEDVPASFIVNKDQVAQWAFLKGRKSLTRISKRTGLEYTYDEGAIPFPDSIHSPSRTILTGEGGSTPSRFKHIIEMWDGRYRRLTPRELERLNGFPGDWTTGMSDPRRAFMMGNALVVGAIERVAKELLEEMVPAVSQTIRVAQAG